MKHLIFLCAAALGGCSAVPTSIVQQPTSSRPLAVALAPPANGAIFQGSAYRPFFEDRRARQVGDLINITITERTNAVKAGASSGNKSGSQRSRVSAAAAIRPMAAAGTSRWRTLRTSVMGHPGEVGRATCGAQGWRQIWKTQWQRYRGGDGS